MQGFSDSKASNLLWYNDDGEAKRAGLKMREIGPLTVCACRARSRRLQPFLNKWRHAEGGPIAGATDDRRAEDVDLLID